MNANYKNSTYSNPVPTRYVFVPCNVYGPGFLPNILQTAGERIEISSMGVEFFGAIPLKKIFLRKLYLGSKWAP